MNLDLTIVYWLTAFHEPAIFVGTILFGEAVVLTASFLAADGAWSLTNVFLFSLAGTLVSDIFWFLSGRYAQHYFKKYMTRLEKHRRYISYIDNAFLHKPWRTMIFIKFLYGARVFMILYLSTLPTPLRRFILADIVASSVLLTIVITVGWFAGAGMAHLLPGANNAQYLIAAIIGVIIGYKLITLWLSRQIDETVKTYNDKNQRT
jgi:membrane protein DedA with SNARE-associated domain